MNTSARPSDEQLTATAASILFDEGNLEAVTLLLSCNITTEWADGSSEDDPGLVVNLIGPYLIVKDLRRTSLQRIKPDGSIYEILIEVFNVSLPSPYYVQDIYVRVTPVDIKEDWKSELLRAISGEDVHNQAIGIKPENIRVWEGLRFRSQSELHIAQALDRAGVLFLPNCKARLGAVGKREGREPDFLICHKGKWGILEVDGEPFHPASRTAQDHARDRLFKQHGIIFVEHYDATECYNNPDTVVREFLRNLSGA